MDDRREHEDRRPARVDGAERVARKTNEELEERWEVRREEGRAIHRKCVHDAEGRLDVRRRNCRENVGELGLKLRRVRRTKRNAQKKTESRNDVAVKRSLAQLLENFDRKTGVMTTYKKYL
jgi:hypothetical protein